MTAAWTPKVGMKVRCIKEGSGKYLNDGWVYSIKELHDIYPEGLIRLVEDQSQEWWDAACRFEPVDDSPPFPSFPNDGFDSSVDEDPYATLGAEIGRLVTEKQKAYGDSFGRAGNVLRELYPDGVKPEQYDDMLALTRILDKCFRIANQKDAFGESPYSDLVGYGLLGAAKAKK